MEVTKGLIFLLQGYRIMIKVLVQYPVRKVCNNSYCLSTDQWEMLPLFFLALLTQLLKMGTSSQDISRSYTEWKIDCKRKLQNGDFGEDMKLKELAGVRPF